MERKPKRRTPERILDTALKLFNTYGEPGVTTTAIADEMNISPGNLYYHYRCKDKIVEALFAAYRAEIEHTLAAPEQRPVHAEDAWLFLHLIFEAIHKYRFIYRDINEITSRYRVLGAQFKRILAHKRRTAAAILTGLVKAGELRASPQDVEALAVNMTVIATYWLSYELARNPHNDEDAQEEKEESRALARGAFHVISLAAPYLAPRERELFDDLSKRYLN
ncbi:TetR family transcriptional regulator [Rhodoblastus acidophilus]|uniref:TetR family transcriptional regulator n=1 Tax=Rhodoblastus acidophilus TaxID=1074 RepID=A0A6N8DJL1_RHOAC|nr:TetR/AcrR family transcriptional regulator [Rhodoblastus acidophilus]MCW2273139.1 AcrR family transcriptional regulator [Rhodoblastus acidophilus]MTV30036.1 TetR family transcriptional regulator [Rhodoblastus acidophilus]